MQRDDTLPCPVCGAALHATAGDPDLLSCDVCGLEVLRLGPTDAEEYLPPWAGWREALEEDMCRGERGRGAHNKRRRRSGRKPTFVPWYQRRVSWWD